jgi:hypothetical protein
MTQVTLNIEDDKLKTFMAFIKTLNYVSLDNKEDIIPQWQKDEVAKSIAEIDNGTAVVEDWDVTRKRLFKKHDISE